MLISNFVRVVSTQINEDHILCSDNCKYEIQILALTAGKGVSMVINCLPGIQNINAGLNCLTHLGILVQVDERECNDLNQLGRVEKSCPSNLILDRILDVYLKKI